MTIAITCIFTRVLPLIVIVHGRPTSFKHCSTCVELSCNAQLPSALHTQSTAVGDEPEWWDDEDEDGNDEDESGDEDAFGGY